jgi:hypothetical protein
MQWQQKKRIKIKGEKLPIHTHITKSIIPLSEFFQILFSLLARSLALLPPPIHAARDEEKKY